MPSGVTHTHTHTREFCCCCGHCPELHLVRSGHGDSWCSAPPTVMVTQTALSCDVHKLHSILAQVLHGSLLINTSLRVQMISRLYSLDYWEHDKLANIWWWSSDSPENAHIFVSGVWILITNWPRLQHTRVPLGFCGLLKPLYSFWNRTIWL